MVATCCSWSLPDVRLLALILMLCAGCKSSQPVQRVAAKPMMFEAAAVAEVPSVPTIIKLQPFAAKPAIDWMAYDTAGHLFEFVSSNACASAVMTYISNTQCWLWHSSNAGGRGTNQFSANKSDAVMLPAYVRVGDALPAGQNSVVIPLVSGGFGFFTLRTSP